MHRKNEKPIGFIKVRQKSGVLLWPQRRHRIFDHNERKCRSIIYFDDDFATPPANGKQYNTNYYNLDAIIAVGYRVNSKKATMFRIWANRVLKGFIIKGYVMDDARLREPENFFGKDYFEEQLERIRDIRSSERRFYQKITDIYSQCSADYDVNSPIKITQKIRECAAERSGDIFCSIK